MSQKESEEHLLLADKLSRIILPSSDISEIGKRLAFELKQLMSIEWAAICLIEKSKGLVRLFPLSPEISWDWELGDITSLDGSPIAWISQNKRALVEPDLAKESRFWTGTFWLKKGIRTIVYIPLFSGVEVFGGLIFASHCIEAYGERELKLLRYATEQIAAPVLHSNLLAPIIKEQHSNPLLEDRLLRLQQAQRELEESISSLKSYVQDLRRRLNTIHRLSEPSPHVKNSTHPRVPGGIQKSDTIKVFIVDEKALYRQGLRLYLSQSEDIEVIGECAYFLEDTVLIVEKRAPDVVLVDINLPSLSGLDLAQQITQRSPSISIILLTPNEDDDQIFEALRVGVAGYLTSNTTAEELANAIRRVAEGNRIINNLVVRPGVARRVSNRFQDTAKITPPFALLNSQQSEILGYFVKNYTITNVAHTMAISEEEIKNQIADIVSNLIANERN